MNRLTLLLPSLTRIVGDPWLTRWLPRADRLEPLAPGRASQLAAGFLWPGTALPAAALLRQHARGDAMQDVWVCADPSFVQIEVNGARLMASGTLDLHAGDTAELVRDLRPVFGDHGALIETTEPARWQLRLPQGAKPPVFDTPEQTLGDDLLPHLPQGDAGRRWRALFNEAQVVLHNHPVNIERQRRGQMPVNALWFWGAGSLPSWVRCHAEAVFGSDALLVALAAAAGKPAGDLRNFGADKLPASVLVDLEGVDPADWWPRIESCWHGSDELVLVFASGERFRLRRRHRWRFWRRGR